MGADFIYGVCRAPDFTDVEDALTDLYERYDNLDPKYQLEYLDQVFGDDEPSDKDVRRTLEVSLRYLWAANRDIGTFYDSAGVLWWLSGGMSWGDTPTEACEHIWRLGIIYN